MANWAPKPGLQNRWWKWREESETHPRGEGGGERQLQRRRAAWERECEACREKGRGDSGGGSLLRGWETPLPQGLHSGSDPGDAQVWWSSAHRSSLHLVCIRTRFLCNQPCTHSAFCMCLQILQQILHSLLQTWAHKFGRFKPFYWSKLEKFGLGPQSGLNVNRPRVVHLAQGCFTLQPWVKRTLYKLPLRAQGPLKYKNCRLCIILKIKVCPLKESLGFYKYCRQVFFH